jgi:hypothetical protein
MPDHPTNIATRKHGYAPSPFAMCSWPIDLAFPASKIAHRPGAQLKPERLPWLFESP